MEDIYAIQNAHGTSKDDEPVQLLYSHVIAGAETMSDLHRVGKEIWNLGPLNESDTTESIQVVQMPHGEEIRCVLGSKR